MNVWTVASRQLVSVYPRIVQGFITPYVWKLSNQKIDDMYKTHTGRNHLEIGPGPDPYNFCKNTNITFMDLNIHSLHMAKNKVVHANTVLGSAIEPDDFPSHQSYDSIGIFNVMHCIHEPSKWARLFYNAKNVLSPGGVIFGSTVLNKDAFSKLLNTSGIFHNKHDNLDQINRSAKPHLQKMYAHEFGKCALFAFKKRNI